MFLPSVKGRTKRDQHRNDLSWGGVGNFSLVERVYVYRMITVLRMAYDKLRKLAFQYSPFGQRTVGRPREGGGIGHKAYNVYLPTTAFKFCNSNFRSLVRDKRFFELNLLLFYSFLPTLSVSLYGASVYLLRSLRSIHKTTFSVNFSCLIISMR